MLCASETERSTEGGEFVPYLYDEVIWPTLSSARRACVVNVTTKKTNAVRLEVQGRVRGGDRRTLSEWTRVSKFLQEKNPR